MQYIMFPRIFSSGSTKFLTALHYQQANVVREHPVNLVIHVSVKHIYDKDLFIVPRTFEGKE